MAYVTIVLPCYNVEEKIEKCLKSLANQTFKDFVAIFVDDGSTDGTAEKIKEFAKDDPHFQYVYKQNGGQASARNLGIKLTESELITFIDSDDYVKENYLEKLVKPFIDHDVQMSACYFERIYSDKTSLNTFSVDDLKLSKYPAVWAKMFKTVIIKENNVVFPEGLWYEDLHFFTDVMQYIHKIEIVRESLYCYIQNENSTMYTYSEKIFDIYKVFDSLIKKYIDSEILEYIMVYHVLVGTVFRASFKPDFGKKTISEIYNYVIGYYPSWQKNKYIKTQLSLFYKIYLLFLKHKQFKILYVILKTFNTKVSL